MRHFLSILFFLFLSPCAFSQNMKMNPALNLIPWPVEVKQPDYDKFLLVKENSTLYCDYPEQDKSPVVSYLTEELRKRNIKLTISPDQEKSDIRLLMRRMPTGGKPAYRLIVDNEITIESNFAAPGFHGVQTLLQLFPTDPLTTQKTGSNTESSDIYIPVVEIFDHARFSYRGMHLDVSRHFSPVSFIKKYIDYLAYHKLNVFHWHLTDDQGWRIEIKKYPELTRIGAWRNGTIIGRYPGTGNDNMRYGGYYSQDEIREVVQYAKDRFIDVIPEIEMPGHSSAAIASYPFLSCFPGKPTAIPANMISGKSVEEQKNGRIKLVQETWGIFDDVFCAGNDSTFIFLQNVIDEVVPLFPSKYFHIGGDECPKTHWKKCPKCQKRIKTLKLKDEHELQSYFVQRIEKYLNKKGKTIIGWDEILEGGLAPNAVVMSWRGEKGGIEAAKQKHYVVMSPQNPVYFDHTQSENEDSVTIGGYNPLEKVYAYEPIPKDLNEEDAKYVLGAQANVWREYIKNEKKCEYMIFPRMSALSEVLWSTKENRNWKSFTNRLPEQMKRYESWGANYSKEYYELQSTVVPSPNNDAVLWVVESKYNVPSCKKCEILVSESFYSDIDTFYFQDGSKIGIKKGMNRRYITTSHDNSSVTVRVDRSTLMNAIQVLGEGQGNERSQKFSFNKATGKKIILKEGASDSYPGNGPFTLVNGVINEKGFSRAREFLGWSGKDCQAIIDLGNIQEISFVTINALKRRSSWIWEPSSAEVFVSSDGENWHSLKSTTEHQEKENQKIILTMAFRKTPARFVKLVVKNHGKIAEGNPGAGKDAWLFIDEIEID